MFFQFSVSDFRKSNFEIRPTFALSTLPTPAADDEEDDELLAELCRRLRLTSIFFDAFLDCKAFAAPTELEPPDTEPELEDDPEAVSSVEGRCCA